MADTVVERTISSIREAIRDGRYAPGQRLIVADVMKTLGVSGGPVREAIRRLTGEGLIEIVPHRGASVKTVNLKDYQEIFELREVVEGLAARLAAERVAVADHRSIMKTFLAEARDFVHTRAGNYIRHNQNFHESIYRMTGNERLRETATQLMLPLYQRGAHHLIDPAVYRIRAAEHELIAEAILAGDGSRAETMMRNHVRNSGSMGKGLIESASLKR